MKANEAPEKIYIDGPNDDFWYHIKDKSSIEYMRKDVFIEKACSYLNENCRRFILTEKDIDDFRNYMEE